MESDTLHSRLARLIQKSRKAVRLYTSMSRSDSDQTSRYTDLQVQEWRNVNSELLMRLMRAVETPNAKLLVEELFSIRDRFQSEWRRVEVELHSGQKELVYSAEQGDFIRAATLSSELVSKKAYVQATQAAHHEVSELLKQSKQSSDPGRRGELKIEDSPEQRSQGMAKVIQLRRKSS